MGRTLHHLRHTLQGSLASVAVAAVAAVAQLVAYPKTDEHAVEVAMEEAEECHEEPQLPATVEVVLTGTHKMTSHHRCLALSPVLSMHLYAALLKQYLCRSLLHIR